MGCFNCDDAAHTMKDCPRPIDAAKAAQRRLDYYAKKDAGKASIAAVLFELCTQVDAMLISERASASEDGDGGAEVGADDDRQLFDALLASRSGAPLAGTVDVDSKADFAMEE